MGSEKPDAYPKEYEFPSGQQVVVKAVPASGYRLVDWSGSVDGSDETVEFTMTCTKTVMAVFAPIGSALTVRVDPAAGGDVTLDPQSSSEREYVVGTRVSLSASAAEGYRFSHWSGDVQGEENPATVVMDAGKEVNAHFLGASQFAWWWVAPGLGVVAIALPVYFLLARRTGSSGSSRRAR